jgi:hypothetical protein
MTDSISSLPIPYVPIVIQSVPAVISSSANYGSLVSPVYNTYKLLITHEATSNFSSYQALPQQYVVTVPTDGVIRLKLLLLDKANSKQSPINRYKVYYYSGEELVDDQYWVIPHRTLNVTPIKIQNTGEGVPYPVPSDLYEVIDIKPQAIYTIVNNLIYFDESAPIGEYTIQYQPGLTLYDIVVER